MAEIALNINKSRVSSTKCCVCDVQYPEKLHRVSQQMRHEILKLKRFYIPKNARACQMHSDFSVWAGISFQNVQSKFTATQIEDMVDLLRSSPEPLQKSVLDVKSDFEFRTDTALTRAQFIDLFGRLPSISSEFKNDKNNQTAIESLYIYLMKLRTGRTHDDIGSIFGITRFTVTERMNKIRKVLENDFVYKNVNFEMTREQLAQRTTPLSQMLFCNGDTTRPVITLDGTYIYIQQSSNYGFQKQTYNAHKKRNFIRVMVCTTTDGTILFVLGPYKASTNDASIMNSLIANSDAFNNLNRGDVILLDRGFSTCTDIIKQAGFDVKIPHSILKKETNKRFTTKQANETRLVTANRYVIETRNGHFKTIFKIFSKEWININLPYMMTDFRVAAALINFYFKTVESHKDRSTQIATRMLSRLDRPNRLYSIVDKNSFQRKVKLFTQFHDFDKLPQLSVADLFQISLGPYQIRQAPSYCQEHCKANNSDFVVFKCPDNEVDEDLKDFKSDKRNLVLLMMRINSRFRSRKSHDVYVLIDTNGKGEECVLEYCCDCQNGLRTVGCCSHVMSLLWFSLYIKHTYAMPRPAGFLNDHFLEEFSSDEDDNDDDEE